MIRVYHPWPVPVRALNHTGELSLESMAEWVRQSRERGLVGPEVDFAVRDAVGELRDGHGVHDVRPSSYLVLGGAGFEVMERMAFLRRYREA